MAEMVQPHHVNFNTFAKPSVWDGAESELSSNVIYHLFELNLAKL